MSCQTCLCPTAQAEAYVVFVRLQGSLAKAMWRTHGSTFVWAGLLKVFHDLVMFTQPAILMQLLQHLTGPGSRVIAFAYATAMLAAALVEAVSVNAYFHMLYRISLHLKSALVELLFQKSLRVSSSVRSEMGAGAIVNLQSNDAAKLWTLPLYLHILWNGPFQVRFGGVVAVILFVTDNTALCIADKTAVCCSCHTQWHVL